jgi:diaminopropionate ammonia-lyase
MCYFNFNPYYKENPDWSDKKFLNDNDMMDFHKSLKGYAPTPLYSLADLSSALGLGEVWIKDESKRFGINAFKALGASYAIYRFLQNRWEEKFGMKLSPKEFLQPETMNKLGKFTFCGATDGNHGRAVAWTAKMLNQRSVIYMPANTAKSRIENIKNENGEVILIDGTFDDCVEKCKQDAKKNNWQAVSDTAYEGYFDIPSWILLGYTTIFREIDQEIPTKDFDFVFLQAGVGGLAAAGTSYFTRRYKEKRPKLICVEPVSSDCFLESIKNGNGNPIPTKGIQDSIMAGLNCGIPSPLAWPIIKDAMYGFLSITDNYAEEAMHKLYYPLENDPKIISGESGSSGMAGLLALLNDKNLAEYKEKLGFNKNSKVLIINTEGDTDPENFRRVVGKK